MTGNPFDAGAGDSQAGDSDWQVVVNSQGAYALWRPYLDLPDGWSVVVPGTDREAALDHIERNWTELGPVERAGAER
ncbi:MbtH family NRPS accessory protein [Streptomyces netropsis]|uniref:MbtH protein n=1 Tax=Streptomyces netropsis TaxID=55404 RepID=A0A7W7LGE3_STRNE|nr:MbtH family NRPS accessory protein [Streptomyces netropsis]MBB4889559.1 MbtH protein [Streptomyces netropsis]